MAGELLEVFVAACKPRLDALRAWLERGTLDDGGDGAAAEFFVAAGKCYFSRAACQVDIDKV